MTGLGLFMSDIDLKTVLLICVKNNMKYLDFEERSHLCNFNFWQLVLDLNFHVDQHTLP
jgi:hypothetical protein